MWLSERQIPLIKGRYRATKAVHERPGILRLCLSESHDSPRVCLLDKPKPDEERHEGRDARPGQVPPGAAVPMDK